MFWFLFLIFAIVLCIEYIKYFATAWHEENSILYKVSLSLVIIVALLTILVCIKEGIGALL